MATLAFCVSLVALVFSIFSVWTSYRGLGHRVRLEIAPVSYGVVLNVNNDSGIPISVKSVGHFRGFNKISWIEDIVGDYDNNQPISLPVDIPARKTYSVFIKQNDRERRGIKDESTGFCIQLDTGRIYVLPRKIPLLDALKIHLCSIISISTAGKYTPWVNRPRIKKHPWS